MAFAKPVLYDRVKIYLNNIPYMPNGFLHSFSMNATYHDSINHGFSSDGAGTGTVTGNHEIDSITWGEYLSSLDNYINLSEFVLANPNLVMLVVPVSLRKDAPAAPQFTITGIIRRTINVSAPNEGNAMIRNVSLAATDSSNI